MEDGVPNQLGGPGGTNISVETEPPRLHVLLGLLSSNSGYTTQPDTKYLVQPLGGFLVPEVVHVRLRLIHM